MSPQSRVLVVEDHPIFLKGLTHLLGVVPGVQVVGEASTRLQALEALEAHRPDLVLVDLTLGDDNGLELIKDMKFRFPDLKVLVLSMHDERYYADRAVAAGALGYCMKEEAVEHLVDAVKTVAAGGAWLGSSLRLADKAKELKARGGAASAVTNLSDREFEVFTWIGHGLRVAEIAARLNLSAKTVDTHKERVKVKLGLASSQELRLFAIQWLSIEDRP